MGEFTRRNFALLLRNLETSRPHGSIRRDCYFRRNPQSGNIHRFVKVLDKAPSLISMLHLNLLLCVLFAAIFNVEVSADWKYKSRPDLAPPTLNITILATSEVSPGYIFVAPYSNVASDSLSHGPLQPGPYIFTSSGELVWSGFGYVTGTVTNFQAAKWKGKDILFAIEASKNAEHGHGHGHVKILDQHYETIKEVRGGNSALLDIHEFHVVNEKTALVESYKPVPYNLRRYGAGPANQWIVEAVFQGKEAFQCGVFDVDWCTRD
jgi:hypothetical protein